MENTTTTTTNTKTSSSSSDVQVDFDKYRFELMTGLHTRVQSIKSKVLINNRNLQLDRSKTVRAITNYLPEVNEDLTSRLVQVIHDNVSNGLKIQDKKVYKIVDKDYQHMVWLIKRYKCGHYYANYSVHGEVKHKRFFQLPKKRMLDSGIL